MIKEKRDDIMKWRKLIRNILNNKKRNRYNDEFHIYIYDMKYKNMKISCILCSYWALNCQWETHGKYDPIIYIQNDVVNTLRPSQMAAFSQMTLSNAFSWMKILKSRLKIHWSLFLMVLLTIFQHWFW